MFLCLSSEWEEDEVVPHQGLILWYKKAASHCFGTKDGQKRFLTFLFVFYVLVWKKIGVLFLSGSDNAFVHPHSELGNMTRHWNWQQDRWKRKEEEEEKKEGREEEGHEPESKQNNETKNRKKRKKNKNQRGSTHPTNEFGALFDFVFFSHLLLVLFWSHQEEEEDWDGWRFGDQ